MECPCPDVYTSSGQKGNAIVKHQEGVFASQGDVKSSHQFVYITIAKVRRMLCNLLRVKKDGFPQLGKTKGLENMVTIIIQHPEVIFLV